MKDDNAIESLIPPGWRFYSADFSLAPAEPGRVLLTRDAEGTAWWHSLSLEESDAVPLFVSGRGATFRAAVAAAVAEIITAQAAPAGQSENDN